MHWKLVPKNKYNWHDVKKLNNSMEKIISWQTNSSGC